MHQVLTSGRDAFIRYKANAGSGLVELVSHDNCSNLFGVCVCACVVCVFVCIENLYIYYIAISKSLHYLHLLLAIPMQYLQKSVME